MTRYAAFLRGINTGGNRMVKMEVLRQAFEVLGFQHVEAVLASGNVLFETEATDEQSLEKEIEKALPGAIGFGSDVFVRTVDDLRKLVRLDPFKNVETTPQIRLYVTFVKGKPETKLKFPVRGRGYTVLGAIDGVVYSIVDLSSAKTPDLMQVLDREFGNGLTTRGWNTIDRILKAI